ncbi:MAG: M48 family metallopeptidase [Bacteroidales bacterium]|nr:M48 family metallopeptidase [Candidatus Cacconaster merdequi]
MVQILFWTIIAIVIAEFALNTTLTVLNIKSSKEPVPEILADVYDSKQYGRQQAYSMQRRKFSLIAGTFSTAVTLAIFASGLFATFDGAARSLSGSPVVRTLIFWGIFYLISWLINIPFDIYSTFVIEERFGFNKTTRVTFISDLFKELAMNLLILGTILSLCNWIYTLTPDCFWILAWAAISLFSLFIQYFYSQLIVPLFNRQTPLPEGELRSAIESFARKVDFKVKDIYVMDSSKRSTHANAYFTGFGRRKRIVLYDTLIEQLDTEEIVSVLAHEAGHCKYKHNIISTAASLATTLLMLYIFNLVISSNALAAAAGAQEASFHLNLAIFSLLYTPVNIVTDVISNIISRRHERQADEFARRNGFGEPLVRGLKKLSARSLGNLTPHPFTVFVEYSHPTLKQRVEALSE